MTEDKALAVREDMSLADTLTLGKVMAESGFFPDTKTAAQAVVKILAGREIGVGPFASMVGVSIIQGKPAIGANLLASKVKDSGRYDYRVLRLDDEGCELEFYERGKVIGKSAFLKADAQRAGLVDKQNWRTFPRNMYFARAASNGVRWYCPNVTTMPVYTPDELGATVNDDGDVVDVQPTRSHGPEWTAGLGEQPGPAAKSEPTLAEVFPREEKPAANGKAAFPITAKGWKQAATDLATSEPYYRDAKGKPDFYHIVGAAKKVGFTGITDDNLTMVLDALRTHAHEQQGPAGAGEAG